MAKNKGKDTAYDSDEDEDDVWPSPPQSGKGKGKGAAGHTVAPETLEAAVEVAALLIRREGRDPDGAYLLRKCGQAHVDAVKDAGEDPDKLASWVCSEARRRSLGLNHKAIVAQRIA